ncbi:MAG TPA: PA14 domain-containing protein [Chryseosolibacter sp.]|nr:PA14 domain-containing protein [Chryseosolibacter sp.]
MKTFIGCWAILLLTFQATFSQVDTTFIYKTNTPFGTLDIRIAKSSSRYYYLQEDKTFSFRESSPGVKTDTYRDMTTWDSSPYKQGNLREKNGTADYFVLNYRLLFPGNYTPTYSAGYPMIVMMHGAGERGNCWDNDCFWDTRSWRPLSNTPPAPTDSDHELLNNDYNLLHGGRQHLAARNLAGSRLPNDPGLPSRSFPGFVLFAQNLNGWDGFSVQDAIRLVRLLVKKYNIDPNRIYVHGLSNGGVATYDIIKRAPWLFAAALPMSAPSESGIIAKGLRPSVSHIPLWIFQGGLDDAPLPSRTLGYIRSFRDAGAIVRYTEYSNLGHGVWNTAYAEPEFFSWMLDKDKANIHLFAGVSTICGTNGQGVRMELAAGFHAYQWERNGEIISGATSSKYEADTPGTYRARFSRKKNPGPSDWNRWSDPVQVTTLTLAKPEISQTGTVVLKGLDNYGYAHLKAEGDFARYYWYKDGVLLNLPGSQDDTTQHVKFSAGDCSSGACSGNGVYTLIVAGPDNCPSPRSDGKYIWFNNQAPINIASPTDFAGSPLSDARVSLTWKDASTSENGFEVWRRRQTGSTTFTKWEMAPITNANATSMIDKGLYPSSTYQYKIRAVGNAGRSNYTPAASNQYLVVVTSGDSESPTVPQNLTAEATGIREIELKWTASTDNSGIKEYMIYYGSQAIGTGSPVTTYRLQNLPLNTDFTFTVRAKDLANNLSAASNSASETTVVTGLFYEHTTGAFSDIDLINWSVAEFEGKVSNFTLSPRTQEDYYNFEFEGYLYISSGGSYQFQTYSDDGSRVTIDNVLAVDNDGQHTGRTVTGPTLSLSAGARMINVKYFDYNGSHALVVKYKGPDTGNTWQKIPDAALTSGGSSSTMLAAESTATDPSLAMAAESTSSEEMRMEIYPNPSRPDEELTLQLTGTEEPVSIKLMDMMGKTYYQKTVSKDAFTNGVPLTTQERLGKGIYIILIQQGNKSRKQTIIVKE